MSSEMVPVASAGEDAATTDAPTIGSASGRNPRSRKLRSLVWNDFTKEQRSDGSYVAICNHCKKQLTASSRSGTTHLKNHLVVCTSTKRLKRKKLVVRRLVLKSADAGPGGAGVPEEDPTSSHFDQDASRQDLARMVIMHGYPFGIVHHAGFRTFVRNLQPRFRMASADAVKTDCMRIFEAAKLRLREFLVKLCARVGLTVDLWRSMDDAEYLCLTCHYVDDEWKLQKKILNFVHLEPSLPAQEIARTVLERLQDWNIERKVASAVLDNCGGGGGDLVGRELLRSLGSKGFLVLNGDMFCACSCGHLLNLVVQDSMHLVQEITEKVRAAVQHVKSSQERLMSFQKAAKQLGNSQKQLVLDVPTSWSSTYIMLETICQYQDAFSGLAECDMEYTNFFSAKDWVDIRAVTECLEVLYQALDKFSATRTPTANLYFNDICGIHLLLKTWSRGPHPLAASLAKSMLEKFEHYWNLTRMLMAIASILDPRYKMKSVEYFFKQIYEDQFEAKTKVDNVRSSFMNLYNEYAVQSAHASKIQPFLNYGGGTSGSTSGDYGNGGDYKSSSRITLSDTRRGLDQYLQETSSSQPSRSDLDMYLEEAVRPSKEGHDENFDILAWWKYNAAKYPILSIMARDILAIPVSVVPLEHDARTLNQYLSSTDPATVQCLICAQDWIAEETEGDTDALALVSAAPNMESNVDECMVAADGE